MMTEGATGGVMPAMIMVALGDQAVMAEVRVLGVAAAAQEEGVLAARLAAGPGTTTAGTMTAGMMIAAATIIGMTTADASRVGRQTSAALGGTLRRHPAGTGLIRRAGGAAAIWPQDPVVRPRVAWTAGGRRRPRAPSWLEGWKA